jgi:hypothetical protein
LKSEREASKEEMRSQEVMVEDFIKLFENRDYEDRILTCLNEEIRSEREEQL